MVVPSDSPKTTVSDDPTRVNSSQYRPTCGLWSGVEGIASAQWFWRETSTNVLLQWTPLLTSKGKKQPMDLKGAQVWDFWLWTFFHHKAHLAWRLRIWKIILIILQFDTLLFVLLPENLRAYFELSAQAWILYKAPQWNARYPNSCLERIKLKMHMRLRTKAFICGADSEKMDSVVKT